MDIELSEIRETLRRKAGELHYVQDCFSRMESGSGCKTLLDHYPVNIYKANGFYMLCRCAVCGVYLRGNISNGSALWDRDKLEECDGGIPLTM